jgi:hypothetical protein
MSSPYGLTNTTRATRVTPNLDSFGVAYVGPPPPWTPPVHLSVKGIAARAALLFFVRICESAHWLLRRILRNQRSGV